MNKAQKKVSLFKTTIGKTLKGLGLAFSGVAVGKLVTDFTKTAMRTEVLDVAMKSVARASGYATQALQEHRKAVMDMGIAEQEASQILTRFMQAQLDTADAAKLARVAQDAAVIAGMDSSQAAEQMTEAIAKQRPILLAQFGMMASLDDMCRDYAKTIGKTASQLTKAEKKQAMLNYILKEGEKIAGTYEASMGVVGKQITSLPRYYQTLQNTVATPLALPGLSVAVEEITNSLKGAISWAEENQAALQRWGQAVANMTKASVKGLKLITGAVAENWQVLKFAGTTLLTYVALTKGAAAATTAWRIATLTLKGELMQKIPVLTAVSTAIGTYRLQMALAPAATNIFTAALLRLRVALYAVHTAIGPIGWAVLGVSALVSGGMALWNKYTQSLQKAAQTASPADLSKGFRDLEKSTQKSANATEEQADALKEAGKAANKNLQSFDEVHQLQEDMAGSAEDMALDVPELEGIGIPELPDMDLEGMMSGLEPVKGTLRGFWEWIKESAGNVWDSVKQKWSSFINWVKSWDVWGWLGQKWSGLKNITQVYWAGMIDVISTAWKGIGNVTQTAWQEVWTLLQTYWNNAVKLATDVFGAIWGFIKGTWDNIRNTTSSIWGAIWGLLKNQWETIKTFAINIFGTVRDLILGKIDLRTAVKQIWGEIKNFFFSSWSNIRDFGINIWTALRDFFINQWSLIQGVAIAIWTAIKDFFVGNWEATKEAASSTWTAIKDFLSSTWEAIKTTATGVWSAIMEFLSINVEETREKVLGAWTRTKDGLLELWDGIIKGAKEKWEGVTSVIKGAVNGIIGFINKFIKAWNKIELKVPEVNIPLVGTVGGWTVSLPEIKEIPMLAEGGIITAPTLAMVGERGPEAVIPLSGSGNFVESIASAVERGSYAGTVQGMRVASASGGQQADQQEVVLRIDSTTLARLILPAIIKEGQRQGLNLVVRPQGV